LRAALPKPRTVSVNGTVIPRDVIAREMQNHPASKPLEAWQAAARALVVRELLLCEARRLGITSAPPQSASPQSALSESGSSESALSESGSSESNPVDSGSAQSTLSQSNLSQSDLPASGEAACESADEALIRQLVEREVVREEPDEAACRRYYDENRERFRTSELFEAAHILIASAASAEAREQARATAEVILAAVLADPKRFDTIAAERSDCTTSRGNGGRLGQISRGQTVAEFDAALMEMGEGEHRIIWTRYGFHIVRLDHRAMGESVPFELAEPRIRTYLGLRAERRALSAYVAVLARNADIAGVELVAAAEGEDVSR